MYEIFLSEYVHNNNKRILEDAPIHLFASYLQGLPTILNVPFMNYEILENAKEYGFILDTEQKEDDFLEKYWFNCASAFFTLKENL